MDDGSQNCEMPKWTVVYKLLFSRWGKQRWWPGESGFEIVIGAILTQNTAWSNVEQAIAALKQAEMLNPVSIYSVSAKSLAELIRPAGYYNIKAQRLKNFSAHLKDRHNGSLETMFEMETSVLRNELLEINGIGPETADSILLYAGNRPVFVVDAYTRRFMRRHGWIHGKESYDCVANIITKGLPCDVKIYNEFHALVVKLGKEHCRAKAKCGACPLNSYPLREETR